MGEPRSQKQQRERLVSSLPAEGKSRVDVAEALRQHYRFNARVAFRYAAGHVCHTVYAVPRITGAVRS